MPLHIYYLQRGCYCNAVRDILKQRSFWLFYFSIHLEKYYLENSPCLLFHAYCFCTLMAITTLGPEYTCDRDPLLMESPEDHRVYSESHDVLEHVIDFSQGGNASSSISHDISHNNLEDSQTVNFSSIGTRIPLPQQPSSLSRNVPSARRGENYVQGRRSPLNSGLWISFELVVVVSQIIAAVIVISLSRHEKPKTPLFEWVICYTVGCIATIPHLYWRYTHRNNQSAQQESSDTYPDSSSNRLDNSYISTSASQDTGRENHHHTGATLQNRQLSGTTNPRLIALVDHFKMGLDFFFAVWFVVGNIWVFGRRSSPVDAPNLYRLCIVFLTFSCIGYAMPFILCAAICCCLPCIVSILGLREDITHNRGATTESINALPIYKYTIKQNQSREETDVNSDCHDEGGILAAGTENERPISGEDAACCICLAKYVDNDELRELPCTHVFHVECIDKWLKINNLCPLCKVAVSEAARSFHRHG